MCECHEWTPLGGLGSEVELFEQDAVAADITERFNCVPVFLGAELKDKHYKGFCKQFLWPLMHYILPMSPASQAWPFIHTRVIAQLCWLHLREVNTCFFFFFLPTPFFFKLWGLVKKRVKGLVILFLIRVQYTMHVAYPAVHMDWTGLLEQ